MTPASTAALTLTRHSSMHAQTTASNTWRKMSLVAHGDFVGVRFDHALDGGSAVCRFCLLRSPLLAGWKIASHWINEKKLGSFCQNSFKLQLLVDILFT